MVIDPLVNDIYEAAILPNGYKASGIWIIRAANDSFRLTSQDFSDGFPCADDRGDGRIGLLHGASSSSGPRMVRWNVDTVAIRRHFGFFN